VKAARTDQRLGEPPVSPRWLHGQVTSSTHWRTSATPHHTLLAPTNSELPRGDGRVTSGLSVVFRKGKVVVRGQGASWRNNFSSALNRGKDTCSSQPVTRHSEGLPRTRRSVRPAATFVLTVNPPCSLQGKLVMHLTYGYDLKENDDILMPARRTGEIMSHFSLPGTALINFLPFRTVSFTLLSLLPPFDCPTAISSQTPPSLGSLVQV
jgi:hypothetical protein